MRSKQRLPTSRDQFHGENGTSSTPRVFGITVCPRLAFSSTATAGAACFTTTSPLLASLVSRMKAESRSVSQRRSYQGNEIWERPFSHHVAFALRS
ncbi:hypothetical protein TNCT_340401 [Trichonephila clavata]|uniref:Uncharacterized protein n=1 Tax=Trichonephila clavata TaxID=2740835 RepID=A0A8X6GGC4_TRICU|nr:hypothetical protein TNCT_340401 [Trichonephila clavata]